ncbi:LysR family transcriptional regulator [Chelatococcus sp. GCM10030263]|uniref:LysR family transcriptional regulator n=1 Tax=Chelatococcus sp. GCM10030263 TaxID=3273387 RepID=UPI00361A52B5
MLLKTSFRYFAAIANSGSIRAAADELRIVQSAVSRQIQNLERDLGAPLFQRGSRGVQLTSAGELVRDYVRDISFRTDQLVSEIESLRSIKRGKVKIAAIESAIPNLIPTAISAFHRTHPYVQFVIQSTTTAHIIDSIRRGQTQIGVVFGDQHAHDLRVAARIPEPLFAVVGRHHPLARERSVCVRQLVEWPVAVPATRVGSGRHFYAALEAEGLELSPALETNSIDLLRRFVLSGPGVTFLPRLMFGHIAGDSDLAAVPIDDPAMNDGSIEILTSPGHQLPAATEAFLGCLVAALGAPAGPTRPAVAFGRDAERASRPHI